MNKKLFLAGVALLAAVGFTSCNSDTPIDGSTPSGVAPTAFKAPSVLADGIGDLNLAIKASTDVDALWNDGTQVTDAMKKELAKLDEMTVTIDCREFKLDGNSKIMTLPDFFQGKSKGKVLNLIFINEFAEVKQSLDIDATKLVDALVNVTVPGQAFEMDVDFSTVRSTLASDGTATIKKLNGAAAAGAKSALQIKDGVTVKAVNINTGDVVENGGDIEALYTVAMNQPAGSKGFAVGESGLTYENSLTYVSDLIVDGDVTVKGVSKNDKGVIGTISIEKGKTLTVDADNITSIENIIGLGDITKDASHLKDVCDKATLIKNVVIDDAAPATTTVKTDNFEGVKFAGDVTLQSESIEGVTFAKNVKVNYTADDKTFTFKGITFTGKINVTGAVATDESIKKDTYQWIVDHYELVKDGKINKDNEGYTAVEYASKDVKMTEVAGEFTILDKNNKEIADHIVTILTPQPGVNLAPKNALVVLDENCKIGTKAATSASVKELTDLFPQPVAAAGELYPEKPWYNVMVGDKLYTWTKAAETEKPYYYYLIAAE